MSFSSDIKNELCRINFKSKCCLLAELAGIIRTNSTTNFFKDDFLSIPKISIITENASFARRIFNIIKSIYYIHPKITIRRNKALKKHLLYIIEIDSRVIIKAIFDDTGILISDDFKALKVKLIKKNQVKKNCCSKAYLRGAFLSCGSISCPEKGYHLEIIIKHEQLAIEVSDIMFKFNLNAKIIKRKNDFIVYLKEAENLVDFLNVIGAHTALLEFENIRILKDVKNNVNRIVNCETANIQRTVDASLRQIENIKYIDEQIGFKKLSKNLKEIGELRLQYKDVSLKELGEMLNPPLGKSGANHRLRKLENIANYLRGIERAH